MNKNEDYNEYARRWGKCRAFAFGDEHDIKELTCEVMPMLVDEDERDYKARIAYAHVDNKVAASMWIYKGLAFRKPAVLSKFTARQQEYVDNIDGGGTSVIEFAKKLHEEHLAITRYGILVDADEAVEGESVAAYAARGGRHKLCFYSAESILDWHVENGKLDYVLLKEERTSVQFNVKTGEFEQKHEDIYRTLDMLDGTYRIMLWRKKENISQGGNEYELISDSYPVMNGWKFTEIPFRIYPEIEPSIPMIMGLVNANIAHLKADVMDANLCRLIATPSPVLAGFSELADPQKKIQVNLSAAIVTNNPNAKWGYLEMAGDGAAAIQARMARLLDEMVAEGSSLLRESPKGVETAETASIHAMGDNSKLSEVSLCVESAINWAMNLLFEWAGVAEGEPFNIQLNRDMMPYPMTPQELDSFVRAHQTGAISYQTLFYNLKKGEVIEAGRTIDEEQGAMTEGM